ncbi:MAG: 50S ribosomal protein L25 [Bacteroidetes bacterium]|nr:50S ribosomal protein L25 [Bacteroidota bacterium]
MNTVAITVDPRTNTGSKSAKVARKTGSIPCVMYGGDDVVHFTTTKGDVKDLIYTPDFKVADITADGKQYRAIVKDVQFHPVTEEIEHIDFLQLVEGKPVKVALPVRFEGTSPGVMNGGKLQQSLRRVKVKTTPENLVEELVLNISHLKLGMSVRVRDIQIGDEVQILSSPNTPVALVDVPRAMRAAGLEEEEEAAGEEGEEGEGEGEEGGDE